MFSFWLHEILACVVFKHTRINPPPPPPPLPPPPPPPPWKKKKKMYLFFCKSVYKKEIKKILMIPSVYQSYFLDAVYITLVWSLCLKHEFNFKQSHNHTCPPVTAVHWQPSAPWCWINNNYSMPQTVSSPHQSMPQTILPPHWNMPQAILPPHWSMPQTISPPHWSMPQAILPPHQSMPQAILPPHQSMPQAILPPHWSMPQAISPPHWSIPQTISPPHWNMPQAILPPHWSIPQTISPPHWNMPQAISPPHWSMPPAILPPHWSMPPAILPPHQRSWLISNWTVNRNHIGVPKTSQTLSQANCIFQNSSHICKPFSSQIYKKINPHTHSMKNNTMQFFWHVKLVLRSPLVDQPVMLTSPYYVT